MADNQNIRANLKLVVSRDHQIEALKSQIDELSSQVVSLRRDLIALAAVVLDTQAGRPTGAGERAAAPAPEPAPRGAARDIPTRCGGCGGSLRVHQAEAGHLAVCNACGATRFIDG